MLWTEMKQRAGGCDLFDVPGSGDGKRANLVEDVYDHPADVVLFVLPGPHRPIARAAGERGGPFRPTGGRRTRARLGLYGAKPDKGDNSLLDWNLGDHRSATCHQ